MWHCIHVCMKVVLTPFVGTQGEDKGFQVCRKKMATSAEVLCKYNAPEFCKFTEAVLEMKFDEDPKYAALIALFEPILAGCVHKPICVDSAIKVRFALAAAAALCWPIQCDTAGSVSRNLARLLCLTAYALLLVQSL